MRRQIALRTLDGCCVRGTGSVTSPSASLTADSTLDVEHVGSDAFLRAQNGLYLSPENNGTVSASCSSPGDRAKFHLEGTATPS
jgi:hypothetical protein